MLVITNQLKPKVSPTKIKISVENGGLSISLNAIKPHVLKQFVSFQQFSHLFSSNRQKNCSSLIAVLKSSFDVREVTTTPNYSLDIISHSYPLTIPKLTPTLLKENIEDEVSVLKETRILTFLVLL